MIQGEILRMTLDGKPVSDNPFYRDDDITKVVNYVWAYGFRNPFGQKIVGDQLFVADNGPGVTCHCRLVRWIGPGTGSKCM